MKYLKKYESFKQPDGTGKETYWEKEVDGELIRVTFNDVISYLDNGIEIDPKELEHLLIKVERSPDRVKNANLEYPIILLSSGGKIISILDGQHRVVKAIQDGVNVKARILDLDNAPENIKNVLT
jgi:hypothetical protein